MEDATQVEVRYCGHCGNRTAFLERGLSNLHWNIDDEERPFSGEKFTTWRMLQCLTCNEMSLYREAYEKWDNKIKLPMEMGIVYPVASRPLTNLPNVVEKAYLSTFKVRHIEPNACAVLAGRTLEIVCNHEKAQGKALADKLQYLANSGRIPQTLAEMAKQLRLLRNLGAHDAEDEITETDVPIIIDFLEAILEYLYVAPAKIAAVQDRLKKTP